jgi:hypothetical protein
MSRFWQTFVLVCAVGFLYIGSVVAQGVTAPKVLQAQRFELVDASGKVGAVIAWDANGSPAVCLYDKTGNLADSWSAMPARQQATSSKPVDTQQVSQCPLTLVNIGLALNPTYAPRPTVTSPDKAWRAGIEAAATNPASIWYKYQAVGVLGNPTQFAVNNVVVSLAFYNGNMQVGSKQVNISSIAPGVTYRFTSDLPGCYANYVELTNITCK